MRITPIISQFLKGLKSAFIAAAGLRTSFSEAIADGISTGWDRVSPRLMKQVIIGAVLVTGVVWLGFGLGKLVESLLWNTPGLGHILVGLVFLLGGGWYLATQPTGVK
ncbi:MAG: hypothetical protein Q8P05_03895 [Candidatus Diapherotrites archaeon]|nr:hypothetical protein [Candidatus Diapherotrites archaeon]MDZ4256090.1 hypothetical protein [archaeon]